VEELNQRNKIAADVGQPGIDSFIKEDDTMHVDHIPTLDAMIRIIEVTPMEDAMKAILLIRITNTQSKGFEILMQYAKKYGIPVKELLDMERHALNRVKDFLKDHDVKDALGRYGKSDYIKNSEQINKSEVVQDGFNQS
jgi:hypothetical protein